MTLKVGDKVRLTSNLPSHFDHEGFAVPGAVATIVDTGFAFPYRVSIEGTTRRHWVNEREVEKIEEPTPKFKMGDRVRTQHLGKTAIGTIVDGPWGEYGGPNDYRVRISDPERRNAHHVSRVPDEMEKVEESAFKVGDKVRLPKWVHTARTGTVVAARPGSDTYEVKADNGVWSPGCARTPGAGSFNGASLTKIESVPFKLERGDKVVNRKTGREGIVQKWSDGPFVTDAKPPRTEHVPASALEEYEEHHPGTYDLIKKDGPW